MEDSGRLVIAASVLHRYRLLGPRLWIAEEAAGSLRPWLGSYRGRKGLCFAAAVVVDVDRVVDALVAGGGVRYVASAGVGEVGAADGQVVAVARRRSQPADVVVAHPAVHHSQGSHS